MHYPDDCNLIIYILHNSWVQSIYSFTFFFNPFLKTLLGNEASRDKILSSLEKLSFTAEKGSVVVIYFSGHGYQLTAEHDQGLLPAGLTTQMVR